MNILLCGTSGFIGRHIHRALAQAGHQVHPTTSKPPHGSTQSITVDFNRDTDAAAWRDRLQGIDAVINAVGVLRDTRQRPIQAVHTDTPKALFNACAQAGVRRVIHISALGIDHSKVLYATTKLAAEQHLLSLNAQGLLDAAILRPSIVFGAGGDSSKLFMALAQCPALMLPRAMSRARVQPVAVGDLADAVTRLLGESRTFRGIMPCVGLAPLSMLELVASLRHQLGKGRALVLPLPDLLTTLSARIGDQIPALPFCTDTLALMQQDNVAAPQPFAALLGREPIGYQHLVSTSWH